MPGFRGTPAGMRMTSDPVKHSLSPDGVGSYPLTVLDVLIWLISAATPVVNCVRFGSFVLCSGLHTWSHADIIKRKL